MQSYLLSCVNRFQTFSSKTSGASIVSFFVFLSSLLSNGRHELSMAYITHPSDQRSQELLYGLALRISGATYPNVPNGSMAFWPGPSILERPKSTILGTEVSELSVIIMFSSLMSRWTIPRLWRYYRPRAIWYEISHTRLSLILKFRESKYSYKESPFMYSRTMK